MKKLIDAIKKMLGMSDKPSSDSSSQGFTLIELLVVIAVIGVLAAAVLIAIDPIEQLSRGRDSGRKNAVSQIGRAFQTYYTANSTYPAGANWDTTLSNAGELKSVPSNGYNTAAGECTGGTAIGGYCYKGSAAATDIVVYTRMESKAEQRKGTCAGVANNTWYVYSSALGRAGVVCSGTQPAIGFSGTMY